MDAEDYMYWFLSRIAYTCSCRRNYVTENLISQRGNMDISGLMPVVPVSPPIVSFPEYHEAHINNFPGLPSGVPDLFTVFKKSRILSWEIKGCTDIFGALSVPTMGQYHGANLLREGARAAGLDKERRGVGR